MPKRILIVDDEPEFLNVVKVRLEAHGYAVGTAIGGREGIRKAKEFPPDLILMDIMMLDLSGGEAVKILKADSTTRHIPVIFLTGLTDGTSPGKVNIDGELYTLVAKPLDTEKFLKDIQEILLK